MSDGIDVIELRKALGCFVTGVTIVTTFDAEGRPRGFTANSFTSVSLDPPLVLVCLATSSGSVRTFRDAPHFAISILGEHQTDLSHIFASRSEDRFERVRWTRAPSGSPVLDESVAWLDCAMHEVLTLGDHVVLVGRVRDFFHSERTPLGYYRSNYLSFGLEQRAVDAASYNGGRIGAIIEHRGHILLLPGEQPGTFVLPTGRTLGATRNEEGSLFRHLERLNLKVEIGFLYAVFDDPKTGEANVYYRGSLLGSPPGGDEFVLRPLDDLPLDAIANPPLRAMLRRYTRDRLEDCFGIYMGSVEKGTVRKLERQSH